MFYILILVGVFLIGLGSFLKKKKKDNLYAKDEEYIGDASKNIENEKHIRTTNKERVLESRIENLEKLVFQKTLREEEVKRDQSEEEGSDNKKIQDYQEKYRLLKRYEGQKKSLDEIAKLLDMNKGEVLLLKNIYKDL